MTSVVDGLQYANWSEKIFRQLREGGVVAVHATITYHENFRETVAVMERWQRWFDRWPDLIFQGFDASDLETARNTDRTAVFFGAQNPSCMEDDIGLLPILKRLGLSFMQLTYNNQSLLASGCFEAEDTGLTRMGLEVVEEMNRLGLVVDMSHSGERSTLEAIDHSSRPIAITHANPAAWHPARRNKGPAVIDALAGRGGMLGLSLYPHHLRGGADCPLEDFCAMVADLADKVGVEPIGIGSDLCQDQDDSVVEWMRSGRWTRGVDFGEGSASMPGFPDQPPWFRDNRDFPLLAAGLAKVGFSESEVKAILGGNWERFFAASLLPLDASGGAV